MTICFHCVCVHFMTTRKHLFFLPQFFHLTQLTSTRSVQPDTFCCNLLEPIISLQPNSGSAPVSAAVVCPLKRATSTAVQWLKPGQQPQPQPSITKRRQILILLQMLKLASDILQRTHCNADIAISQIKFTIQTPYRHKKCNICFILIKMSACQNLASTTRKKKTPVKMMYCTLAPIFGEQMLVIMAALHSVTVRAGSLITKVGNGRSESTE